MAGDGAPKSISSRRDVAVNLGEGVNDQGVVRATAVLDEHGERLLLTESGDTTIGGERVEDVHHRQIRAARSGMSAPAIPSG